MKDSKVLIITYYWPPAGGPGVQRWLKFAKHLPEFGIQPVIYTPENASFPVLDNSLLNEVSPNLEIVRTKIWEPYQWAERLNPTTKSYKAGHFEKKQNQSFLTKLSVFVRGNFFIPDARKFWIKPSVRFLEKFLQENQIKTIITTGPPHSLHLIGLKLKQKNPSLNWIADFRDPWTQISYFSELKLTSFARNYHLKFEKNVMESADVVLATSFTDAENYQKIGAKCVKILTNGFEPTEFEVNKIQTKHFKITYSGGLEIARNPKILWEALQEICAENHEFEQNLQIVFYGSLSKEVESDIASFGLQKHLIQNGYVSHKESIEGIINADLLFLSNFPNSNSRGIIPGKLFEYLATRNPIIAVGPDQADVERILNETKSGKYFNYNQMIEVKNYISEIYSDWKFENNSSKKSEIQQYNRKNITENLAKILKSFS